MEIFLNLLNYNYDFNLFIFFYLFNQHFINFKTILSYILILNIINVIIIDHSFLIFILSYLSIIVLNQLFILFNYLIDYLIKINLKIINLFIQFFIF